MPRPIQHDFSERINSARSISDFLAAWLENDLLDGKERRIFGKYYANYIRLFDAYIRHHYASQSREIADLIQTAVSPRLLEIGAGCGTESLWFCLKGARVTAIDINPGRLAVARRRQQILQAALGMSMDVTFMQRSLFDITPGPGYDLIWMEQSFHHVEPRTQTFSMLANLLRPGGHIVVSEANAWNPILQAQLLRKRGLETLKTIVDEHGTPHHYGNERILTPMRLVAGFKKVGITKEAVRFFRLWPNVPLSCKLFWLERFVPQRLKFPFTHYNFVGVKNSVH
jgi:2-polyprenyl-3-methyl-5-hydroxy-6-metoxy-1,4-benzoquinol methylase